MSLAIVRSIRQACYENGERVLRNLNLALKSQGLREITDSESDHSGIKKLPCGSIGARGLWRLVDIAKANDLNGAFVNWVRGKSAIALRNNNNHGRSLAFYFPPAIQFR
jgi:hypothetical protein